MCIELPSDFPLNDVSDQLMDVTSPPAIQPSHDPSVATAAQPILQPASMVRIIMLIIKIITIKLSELVVSRQATEPFHGRQ